MGQNRLKSHKHHHCICTSPPAYAMSIPTYIYCISSSAARALCDGDEISHGRAHWSSGSHPINCKPVVLRPLYFRKAPLKRWMGPLEHGMGSLRPKIGPCRPGMSPRKHLKCLFSLNVDSGRLQHLIVRIENGPS